VALGFPSVRGGGVLSVSIACVRIRLALERGLRNRRLNCGMDTSTEWICTHSSSTSTPRNAIVLKNLTAVRLLPFVLE
jgi:hypothetical protein